MHNHNGGRRNKDTTLQSIIDDENHFNRLGFIWVLCERKNRSFYFLVSTYPWREQNPRALCALICVGTVGYTFIDLIEKRKSKLCQVSGGLLWVVLLHFPSFKNFKI